MKKKRGLAFWFFSVGVVLVFGVMAGAAEIQDSESASHDFDAASQAVVDTYNFSGFRHARQ